MAKNKGLTKTAAKQIRLLILDVDGVMTDGRIGYDNEGNEYRFFHVHDGYGIQLLQQLGIKVAIISGKFSPVISRRAQELGIKDVFLGVTHKEEFLSQLLHRYKLPKGQVAAIGDDLLDLSLLKKVGFPIAVANARPEVKRIAKFVTRLAGGQGAVREIADYIRLWAGPGPGKR